MRSCVPVCGRGSFRAAGTAVGLCIIRPCRLACAPAARFALLAPGLGRIAMGVESSGLRHKRLRQERLRQEKAWAAMAGPVTVRMAESLGVQEDSDG